MKRLLRLSLVGALLAGLVAVPTAAFADHDDRRRQSGACSAKARYTMSLREVDDDRFDDDDVDRIRVRLTVNARRADRDWDLAIRRRGEVVHRGSATTGPRGNFSYAKTIRADEDHLIRVGAKAPGGQTCSDRFRLDRRGDR